MDYKSKIASSLKSKKNPLVELVEELFNARDVIHLAHLKTTSYAQHVALGDFYDAVLGYADELVETAQGCEGKLLDISISTATYIEPLSYLMKLKESLLSYREQMEYEFQKNIIDEITALTAKTIYKLKFLK